MKTWLSETLDLGIHALTGGQGTTAVLVPGWPETAEGRTRFPVQHRLDFAQAQTPSQSEIHRHASLKPSNEDYLGLVGARRTNCR